MTRNTRKYSGLILAAGLLALSVFPIIFGGCGGGGNAALGAIQVAQSEHGKKDQPVIPIPFGHPNRIVFVKCENDNCSSSETETKTLMGMDPDGGNPTIVASDPNGKFNFIYPAMSQDGLTTYFNAKWYATSSAIVSVRINNSNYKRVLKNFDTDDRNSNFEAPRISWSGKKMAFTAYKEISLSSIIDDAHAHIRVGLESGDPATQAQIGVFGSGAKLTAYPNQALKYGATDKVKDLIYSNNTTTPKGIISVTGQSTPNCKAQTYNENNQSRIPPTIDPLRHYYFCVNIDNVNYAIIDVKEKTNTSNPNQLVKFEWYLQDTTMTPITVVLGKTGEDEQGNPIGEGYNFIQEVKLRQYDLYTYDLDGSTAPVKHTDDEDPDRFPCFSPNSDDFVYMTYGSFAGGGSDYDMPEGMNIYRFDLTNNTYDLQPVITDTTLNKHCSVSPSGKMIAYSHYNGTDYDIYLYDMNLNPPASRVLANDRGNDMFPVFSPNGSEVAFQSDLTGDIDIYKVNIYDGNPPINLTNNYNSDDYMPAWAP